MYYQEPIKKRTGRSVKHPRKKSNSVCTAYYNEVTINSARQTTPQHDHGRHGYCNDKARRYEEQGNKRLPAPGKKKLLLAEVHKEDQDILAKALEALWKL